MSDIQRTFSRTELLIGKENIEKLPNIINNNSCIVTNNKLINKSTKGFFFIHIIYSSLFSFILYHFFKQNEYKFQIKKNLI